jgi:hypothetical protein
MSDQPDPQSASDEVKKWTIKNIPPEERNAAIAAADRADMTIGEWMTRAIRTQIKADLQQDRAPTIVLPTSDQSAPGVDLGEVERMAEVLAKLHQAGAEVDPGFSKVAYQFMKRRVSPTKPRNRPTKQPKSPTMNGELPTIHLSA